MITRPTNNDIIFSEEAIPVIDPCFVMLFAINCSLGETAFLIT